MRLFATLISVLALSLGSSFAYAKFKVVTTFTIIQDMAQNIAGDAATVESITEGIEPMSINEGPYTGNPNPHAWMSPSNALIYIENIKNALVKYDPQNKETYEKNAALYAQKIKALDKPLREKLAQVPEAQRWLVTSEGAFSYLTRDYGFKEAYLWPINAEQQGTPQQVRKVIETVKANKIPVVFSESTISPKPAKQVAKESGAKYGGVLYVDSLSNKNGPVPTYVDLLNTTVSTIVKGFEK